MRILNTGDMTQLWLVLLCVAVSIGIAAFALGVMFLWKQHPIFRRKLPHCDLQARLGQVAKPVEAQKRTA